MEELFKIISAQIGLALQGIAVLIVLYGALDALWSMVRLTRLHAVNPRRQVWTNFGRWLVLGLEFQLGADIIRTSVAPTWNEIGQLAAIAIIRTFLAYFLEVDLSRAPEPAGVAKP